MIGIVMIFAGLLAQFVVVFIIIGILGSLILGHFGLSGKGWFWTLEACAAILLNCLIVFEFRRMRGQHKALGIGGTLFLLPRGIYRVLHGRETFLEVPEAINDRPGFPVLPAATAPDQKKNESSFQ